MNNFLIYDHVEVRLGPYLNMILGPNGTGKSELEDDTYQYQETYPFIQAQSCVEYASVWATLLRYGHVSINEV